MAIFVYTETNKNGFTPISLEAISFAKKIASQKKEELVALCINAENPEFLQKFGANKIISIHSDSLTTFNAQCYAQILAKHIDGLTIFPHTIEGQSISGVLSVLKKSSLITQVNSYPESLSPFILKKNIFSEKAEMIIYPNTENLVLTLIPHVFNIEENHAIATIETYHIKLENPFKLIHKEEKNSLCRTRIKISRKLENGRRTCRGFKWSNSLHKTCFRYGMARLQRTCRTNRKTYFT